MDTMVADALVGRTVDGRYRVDARVAAGGMATVYRATDLRLDRPVALKVMKASLAEDPEFVGRFRTEARAAARLSHPNVVGVFDQGAADGLVYLVMEFVPGRTLRDIMHDVGPLSPEQALSVLDPALQAISAAHDAGFLHRDIKPENVLVADNGTIKVTDFGLARALELPSSATQGVLLGTAAYLAPEQVSEGESDQRSDVYQAGVLLFEMLAGTPPHSGDSPWAVAYQHVNTDVPRLDTVLPDTPPGIVELIADATARDRDLRIASVPDFLARIRTIRATLPPPVPFPARTMVIVPDTTTTALERPQDVPTPTLDPEPVAAEPPAGPPTPDTGGGGRRRPWVVGVVVILVAALVAGGAGWLLAGGNPFDRTDVPEVVGAKEAKATGSLTAVGFTVEVTDRLFSESAPSGTVIASDPGGGTSAATGSTVGLVVSLGPERYAVPKVKGQSPAEATATLAATNLQAGSEKRVYHDSIDEGTVVGTDPEVGTEVKRDTVVTLLVSKGPAPVDVPDLSGTPQDQAVQQLAADGLKYSISTRESRNVAKGVVITTEPGPGATVYRGDTVQVIVSEGPPPVTMPNVVDQPRDNAVAQLEALGLKVKIDEGIVTPLGRVYSQDPTPGSSVPVGSTVTLSIF
ncbi:MAG: Stk1 family PASTA domain-containing Ser/Thr kinase [Candidatus Nanopelagicales bacterium]